jgi:roadblock/LC7 domain-containing protein
MKKRVNILILSIIVCGLIISCNKGSENIAAMPTAAMESSPTANLHHDTATLAPLTSVEPKYDLSCWQIKPLQEAKDVKGSLIYSSTNISNKQNGQLTTSIWALDVNSMTINKINGFGSPELFSPNFKKIASQMNKKIFIITPDDVQTYSVPSFSFHVGEYLTDGRIRLNSLINDTNYEKDKGLDLKYYILDPANGEIQKNTVFLPDYYETEPGDRTLSYSPDMKYILYRSTAHETEAEFTLFDLEKNKVVWVGPTRDNNLVYLVDSHLEWQPQENWSYLAPDWMSNTGTLTALFLDKSSGQIKYYSISTDGNISPIADFDMTDIVNGAWSQAAGARIVNHPIWSPDRRYLLTFGKAKDKDIGNYAYIWDSQENIVYKPCLPNETGTVVRPRIMQYSDPSSFIVQLKLWSTLFPEDRSSDGLVSKNYILDPVNKIIYEIPDLNRIGNPFNTDGDEIAEFFGWVDWETP